MSRSKHPGVWLVTRANRAGETTHFARWRDPVSGRRVEISLDRLQLTNDRQRERWAKTKSAELARELQAIAAGDAPREPVALADAIAEYEADCEARQTVATLRSTRQTLEVLREWAAAQRIETTAELTPQRVATFARYLSTLRARRQASGKGTPRGARRYTDEPLHPRTINRHLSTWKAILNKWRLWRLVTLTSDDIRELTKPLRTQKEPPRFLAPHEIKALLEAAMRYDDEARRGVPPIAPVVLFGLLTGMRLGEGWLGHAVEVMETYYARRLRGIAHDARTLEAAMQVEALATKIIARITGADSPADSPSESSAASG